MEFFTDATKLDPSYARAYVEIGNCYASLGIRNYMSYEETVAGMKSGARKALGIDENLAEGHALLSYVAWAEDDRVKDEEEATRAIELNPNLAIAYLRLATVKATNGYPKSSMGLLETAHLLDPLSAEVIRSLGFSYLWSERENGALDLWNGNHKIVPFVASRCLAYYYMQTGDLRKAEEEVELLETASPNESNTILQRGCLSAIKGDRAGAERAIGIFSRKFKGGARTVSDIGYIKFFLGDIDGYYAGMFQAVKSHVFNPLDYRYSPLFENARRDPRYREVLLKNGLDPELKEWVTIGTQWPIKSSTWAQRQDTKVAIAEASTRVLVLSG